MSACAPCVRVFMRVRSLCPCLPFVSSCRSRAHRSCTRVHTSAAQRELPAACGHMRRTNSRETDSVFMVCGFGCAAREDGRRDRPVRQHVAADSGKARRRVAPERLCLLPPPPPGTFCGLAADGRLRLAVSCCCLPCCLLCLPAVLA